ncbi:DnaJ domain-containing protein [Zhongshania guokunii]|uniref:DnaJ domain-containing protein n=1 Tax=Zhongshania guokunii TaxID=641783 RepID=A0ABV3U6Y7_9GAMM
MIIRLFFAVLILYGIYRFVKTVQTKPVDKRRGYYISLLIGLAAAALVLLSLTGRVHWIAGLIGGALPFVRQYVLKHIYHRLNGNLGSSNKQQNSQQDEQAPPPRASTSMNKNQALSVLGLSAGASDEEIIAAHRKLMQKFHPDRGGNDFLASQINDAKDVLLGRRGR